MKLFETIRSPKAVSELKVALGEEAIGQFFPGPIKTVVPSFRNSLTEYMKGDGRHS